VKRESSRIFLVVITMVMMVVAFTPRAYGCLDANFYYEPPYTVPVGDPVTFNASTSTCDWNSTINYTYPIVSYDWDFGDGATDEGEVVTHIYTEQGTYSITLEITDEKGDSVSAYAEIKIGSTVNEDEFPLWIPVVVVAAGIGVALPVYFLKVRKPTK